MDFTATILAIVAMPAVNSRGKARHFVRSLVSSSATGDFMALLSLGPDLHISTRLVIHDPRNDSRPATDLIDLPFGRRMRRES